MRYFILDNDCLTMVVVFRLQLQSTAIKFLLAGAVILTFFTLVIIVIVFILNIVLMSALIVLVSFL